MSCSSSLIDVADPLVLDTSVLINLHACKYGERILAAIPNDTLIQLRGRWLKRLPLDHDL